MEHLWVEEVRDGLMERTGYCRLAAPGVGHVWVFYPAGVLPGMCHGHGLLKV